MSDQMDGSLPNLVNASGFVFQMAIEHLIRTTKDHGWRITSAEHPWRCAATNQEGFIDLDLEKWALTAVIECKRPRGGAWVFLIPSSHPSMVTRVRCLWVAGATGGPDVAGWHDFGVIPESPESSFCVVRGSGEGD